MKVRQTPLGATSEYLLYSTTVGGFSLFGNLAASGVDLDDFELESDQEQSYHAEATPRAISHSVILEEVPAPVPVMRAQLTRDEVISFDPSIPLLFPVPPRLRSSKKGARPKDIFDIAKDKGWTGGFYKTATEYVLRNLISCNLLRLSFPTQ